jgi:hypothetical protein
MTGEENIPWDEMLEYVRERYRTKREQELQETIKQIASGQEAAWKVDRTGWREGPWDQEEDIRKWSHAGFPCAMVRNQLGNWCGYAGVYKTHPCFELEADRVAVDIHGGLTYFGYGGRLLCLLNEQPGAVWFLGFDCGHVDDYVPGMDTPMFREIGVTLMSRQYEAGEVFYRTQEYVAGQVNYLADQLREIQGIADVMVQVASQLRDDKGEK